MDNVKKDIILVSYQFCPMGGIGTRRWSKFAKYLSQSGYRVHVISADYKSDNNINWCHDVKNNSNIIVHQIKMKYPQFLLNPKRTFKIKFFERLIKTFLFAIDFGQYTEPQLERKLKQLFLTTNSKIVITTGGPYSQFYYLAKIKNKLDFKLILDYRDPWNLILKFRGPFKSFLRQQSQNMENYALKNANKVLFTNNDLRDTYVNKYPQIKPLTDVLFNGYDLDDYKNVIKVTKTNNSIFQIIYLGSITEGRAEAIALLLDTIRNAPDSFNFKQLRINIYAPNINSINQLGEKYKSLIEDHIIHHSTLPPLEAMQKLSEADACLSINEKRFSYLIGAKTYDYMALKKPILHISDGGELSEILKKTGQFVSDYSIENCQLTIQKLLNLKADQFENKYETFELSHLTEQLINKIENVQTI